MTGIEASTVSWVVTLRRELHQYPEPSALEARTASLVAEALVSSGCKVFTGIGKHGVAGLLEGARPGPFAAFRAELDGLPIEERTGLPYASRNAGYMHACGHDAHMAILLGAARVLSEKRDSLAGRFLWIFQPAEERAPTGGASTVLEFLRTNALLPDRIYAFHVWPDLPAGTVAVSPGPVMAASDRFEATFRGPGGHAGIPERTKDALLAASFFVSMSHAFLPRESGATERLALSMGAIDAGLAANVVPTVVKIRGSVRSWDEEIRTRAERRLREIAAGVGKAAGVRWQITYSRGYPVVINHGEEAQRVAETARQILGENAVLPQQPTFVADDFGRYLNYAPGCMVFLGCSGPDARGGLHRPDFILDERCLEVGVALLVALAKNNSEHKGR